MSKKSDGKFRQSKLATRSQILERACEMYFAHELVHGDERLSLVLDSLGYTTGAGYQIWANQASFRRDLQVLVAQRLDFESLSAGLVACIDGCEGLDLEEAVEPLGRDLLTCILDHEGFYLSLRFLALGSSCPVEISEHFVEERAKLEMALAFSLDRLSRRAGGLPGLDGTDAFELSASLLALLEGFALRVRVNRDSKGGQRLFVYALEALFGLRGRS